jgi:hypothetical protein
MVVSCPPCWVLLLVKADASLPTSAFEAQRPPSESM